MPKGMHSDPKSLAAFGPGAALRWAWCLFDIEDISKKEIGAYI